MFYAAFKQTLSVYLIFVIFTVFEMIAGRATVMNLFRVPLNFIVIIILTQVPDRLLL